MACGLVMVSLEYTHTHTLDRDIEGAPQRLLNHRERVKERCPHSSENTYCKENLDCTDETIESSRRARAIDNSSQLITHDEARGWDADHSVIARQKRIRDNLAAARCGVTSDATMSITRSSRSRSHRRVINVSSKSPTREES